MHTRFSLAALLVALLALAPSAAQAQCAEADQGVCVTSVKPDTNGPATSSATGDVLRSFAIGTSGGTPVGLENTMDGSSFPYVMTDIGDDTVHRMDANGNLGTSFSVAANSINPIGITTDGTFFYITDTGNQDVDVYDLTGAYQSSFSVAAQTTFPEGITYNPTTGNLYVVDGDGDNFVHVYTLAGAFVTSFAINGSSPDGIAWSAATSQYVIYDSGTDTVRYYDTSFNEVSTYPGTIAAGFSGGEGVALNDATNEVHVVATGSDTGVVFEAGLSAPAANITIAVNTFDSNPTRGNAVFFRGPLSNTGGASQFVYVYFTVDVPGVGTYQRNLGGLTMPAGATINYRDIPGGKKKNYVPLTLDAPAGTYTVTVYAASDKNGTTVYDTDSFQFTLPPLATVASLPGEASLEAVEPGAAPNPFRDATTFTYAVAEDAPVDLRVYDVTGREVSALVSGTQAAGTHTATLRAGDLPGGVYVWRLAIGGEVSTGRITLAR